MTGAVHADDLFAGSNAKWKAECGSCHVAYPARADNPITRLIAIVSGLKARAFNDAHAQFDASNLEIVDLEVGNPATNVIPAKASARLNIRFNDRQRGADLEAWLREVVARHAPAHQLPHA